MCSKFSGSLKQRLYQKRWQLLVLLVFTITMLLLRHILPQHFGIYYGRSTCLPYKVYVWKKSNGLNAKRDDFIVGLATKMQPLLADGERIGKQVKGIAGDTVEIKNGIVKINGKYLTTVEYGAKNRALALYPLYAPPQDRHHVEPSSHRTARGYEHHRDSTRHE